MEYKEVNNTKYATQQINNRFSVKSPMEFHNNATKAAKNPSQNCEERQRFVL